MISPLQAHLSETLTSLKFATKVNYHVFRLLPKLTSHCRYTIRILGLQRSKPKRNQVDNSLKERTRSGAAIFLRPWRWILLLEAKHEARSNGSIFGALCAINIDTSPAYHECLDVPCLICASRASLTKHCFTKTVLSTGEKITGSWFYLCATYLNLFNSEHPAINIQQLHLRHSKWLIFLPLHTYVVQKNTPRGSTSAPRTHCQRS